MTRYRTVQGPLYLALAFQAVILLMTFFAAYSRPWSIAAGCAAGTAGLLLRTIFQLRGSHERLER